MKPHNSLSWICFAGIVMSVRLGVESSCAGDFLFHSIGKGVYYDQTSGGAPALKTPYPWLFQVQVVPYSNYVHSATLRWAPIWSRFLYGPSGFSYDWDTTCIYATRHGSQAELEKSWPNTNYWFEVWTRHDSYLPRVTNYLSDGAFPNAPEITNLVGAQDVDPGSDFSLHWNAFEGATSADYIYCQLQTQAVATVNTPAFHTGYAPGTSGALDGTAISVTIPAKTLLPGRAYLGRLVFARVLATTTNEYPGASGATLSFSQTDFWLRTKGPGDTAPPFIVATDPPLGAADVPINKPLSISFSKPMRTNSFVGFGSYWSPDGLTYVITSHGNANQVYGILLNPYELSLRFSDQSRNPLAADAIVAFTNGASYLIPPPGLLTNANYGANGRLEIDVLGEAGYPYVLESSSNLTDWVAIQTNIAFRGTAHFVVTNEIAAGLQTFRAVAR